MRKWEISPTQLRILALIAFAVCATRIVAASTFEVPFGEVTARMTPALPGGQVSLHLGPFGELRWNVHDGPLNLEASFVVDRDAPATPEFGKVDRLYMRFIAAKAFWLIAAGGLLGLLAARGTRREHARAAAIGGASALGLAVLLTGISFLTFDSTAFGDVRYRGPIEDAPRVLSLIKEIQRDWEGTQRNIGDMVAGLERIHGQIVNPVGTPEASPDAVRLLVVSDIHNNPLGLLLAEQLVRRFRVHGVLDAGDLTDRGTRAEGEIFARFADLGVPYVIAPGNHEDTAAVARAEQVPNVTVFSRTRHLVEIEGLEIMGAPDPNSASVSSDPHNETALREIPAGCEALARRRAAVRPDIVLVHNPDLGACAAEEAEGNGEPLIYIWGHMHRAAYEERGSVLAFSPGTSGANGLKTGRPAPYGIALLEVDRATSAPRSVCLFSFDNPSQLRQADCRDPRPSTPAQPSPASPTASVLVPLAWAAWRGRFSPAATERP